MVAVLMSQLKLAAMVLLSKLARVAARPAALAAGRAGPRTVRALPHLGFRRFSSNGPPKGCAQSCASRQLGRYPAKDSWTYAISRYHLRIPEEFWSSN